MADLSLQLGGAKPVSARPDLTKRYFAIGWGVVLAVFGGLVAWSVFAPFEGAVMTSGQVAVESNQQAVQHLEGGIVREIYVREADQVTEGQRLISLDPTNSDAGVQALEARLFELLGTEARLLAERDGASGLEVRPGFEEIADSSAMKAILSAQTTLKGARESSRSTQTRILEQRIEQLSTQIAGMRDEIASKDNQINLLDGEIKDFQELLDKGLAPKTRVLALQRDRSRLQGEKDALVSRIASTRVQIGEARSEMVRLTQGFQEEVLTELRDVQTQIGELAEQRTSALDRQTRLDILAPRAGRVIGIRAHTVGGIIAPLEPIMHIVPDDDRLVAKVRINLADIDKIVEGQDARLMFSAFNQEETPQFSGRVLRVSPDALTDPQTGMPYYEAVVEIPDEALNSSRFTLLPGMPVEVMLRTESRNVLSYLVKPLTDSISRTFRE